MLLSSSGIRRSSLLVPRSRTRRSALVVLAGQKDDRSRKGAQFEGKTRRRGRPAWMRSPYDSPLRDGNRDRLIGLLTERAAKTLMIYLMETNANVYGWLVTFYKENPIPKQGSWDEVSGEAFLRKLLSMPIEEAKYNTGRDSLFDNVSGCGVDPRSIAQRIMDIRTQLSEEFIQELKAITEENSVLLRETLNTSLLSSINSLDETSSEAPPAAQAPQAGAVPDSSSSSSSRARDRDRDGSGGASKIDVSLRPSFGPKNLKKPRNPAPPLNAPAASGSGPQEGAGSLADKAAAVAALNAALRAALPPDVLASHPDLGASGSSGVGQQEQAGGDAGLQQQSGERSGQQQQQEGVSPAMEEVIAQLKRSLEADVAALCSFGDPEAEGEEGEEEEGSLSLPADLAPPAPPAAAAAEDQPTPGGSRPQRPQPHMRAADACLAAVLPKGWGPRLGTGYSSLSAPRNNIVSTAKLPKGVAATASLDGGTGAASSTSSL